MLYFFVMLSLTACNLDLTGAAGLETVTATPTVEQPIEEVIEQPHQVLLKISLEGNEALIPLHAESLDRVDHEAKKVYVILPDGLLDVYRS